MSPPLLAVWLATLTALAVPNASAQGAAAVPKSTATVAAPGAYRSALDGYQAFSEESVQPWKASNDTVRTVGGWRAYAREASEASGKAGEAGKPPAAASGPRTDQPRP